MNAFLKEYHLTRMLYDQPNIVLMKGSINGNNNKVEDTFFCHTLCNYRNSCKHIKSFDELQKLKKETHAFQKGKHCITD